MELTAIKDLMAQFDASSLREFSYKNGTDELVFSKNETSVLPSVEVASTPATVAAPAATEAPVVEAPAPVAVSAAPAAVQAEGEEVGSPLVGVAYLSPAPDKPAFVSVGDRPGFFKATA